MLRGIIFDLKKYSINDGPGIRTTVFMKGCPLRCAWCHNPESQSPRPEMMLRTERCTGCAVCVETCPLHAISNNELIRTDRSICTACGECAKVCFTGARQLLGYRISVEDLLGQIERDVPFYDQSGGGVTFSGGEPLMQPRFLQAALSACRAHEINTTVDTSGYAPWRTLDAMRPLVNLFLYDLKLMDDARHIQYTGVSNRRILTNLHRLCASGAAVIVRLPLIPGVNDDTENLTATADFLTHLPALAGVEVMPYHNIAAAKYTALDRNYSLPHTLPPSVEQVQQVIDQLAARGLPVKQNDAATRT